MGRHIIFHPSRASPSQAGAESIPVMPSAEYTGLRCFPYRNSNMHPRCKTGNDRKNTGLHRTPAASLWYVPNKNFLCGSPMLPLTRQKSQYSPQAALWSRISTKLPYCRRSAPHSDCPVSLHWQPFEFRLYLCRRWYPPTSHSLHRQRQSSPENIVTPVPSPCPLPTYS